jgi:MFS family permease
MATTTGQPDAPATPLTPVQWTICVIAAIGFAFDSYELLMLPLIVRPALSDLLGVAPNSLTVNEWVGTLLYVPAVAGGIFGLLGGYLTDLFGRRRVLVWSILIYAFSTMAAGYSTTVGWLLFWRCCTFVGVCVEFVAAVAWLAELFPNARQRERVIGYTQAFGSIGGVLVTGAYYVIVIWSDRLPAIHGAHEAWRYTMISGVIPAIPLIVIRPFLPESPMWRAKKEAGTLKRPSVAELFRPAFRRTTVVTTLMMACGYAVAYGAIQQMPRIVPGLAEVSSLPRQAAERAVSTVQSFHETGGLAGRLLLAYLAVRMAARPHLLRIFLIPGMFVLPFVFIFAATSNITAAP